MMILGHWGRICLTRRKHIPVGSTAAIRAADGQTNPTPSASQALVPA
ncbi:hypothetical protein [Nitrincola sp.]